MSLSLKNKKILLGITGSIAAYKSAELIRLLKDLGAEVHVIMTEGANTFITPMTVQALSGNSVHHTLWDPESEAAMSHITLARWADLILVAPATANLVAKLASGFADDLLTTACLASQVPILLAPAMNVVMWSNTATQENIAKLQQRNIQFIGPAAGIQACGETGEGRMSEPEDIVAYLDDYFHTDKLLLGKNVLITAGPTQEAIDPVRYISNHSSGKMGYALAEAFASHGASVTLISGPTALNNPSKVKRIDVISAQQMYKAVMENITDMDVFVSTAAVSDYCPTEISAHKIKKTNPTLSLALTRTPDILSAVGDLDSSTFIVGFAAETENVIHHAKEKLKKKNCDMLVANLVGDKIGFKSDFNELFIIHRHQEEIEKLAYASKKHLANELASKIAKIISTDYKLAIHNDEECENVK